MSNAARMPPRAGKLCTVAVRVRRKRRITARASMVGAPDLPSLRTNGATGQADIAEKRSGRPGRVLESRKDAENVPPHPGRSDQAEKEEPQPQVLLTFGLENLNPEPSMVST